MSKTKKDMPQFRERNYLVLALIRSRKRSVAHGKTKKAERRGDKTALAMELRGELA